MRSHEWIDRRSLALHERVAVKLAANPALLEAARVNLERWLQSTPSDALREWRQLIETISLPKLIELLRSPSETAARLRQSSPFAGVLSTEERLAILREYESRRS